jgi:hypothetical protein
VPITSVTIQGVIPPEDCSKLPIDCNALRKRCAE